MERSPTLQLERRTHRRDRHWTRRGAALALFVAGLALALPAKAGSGERRHRWHGPGDWIERNAGELGIDETTLAEIDQIVDVSREEAEAIYEEHRAARDAMHEMLEQDEPDRDAVMRQVERIGEIDVRKHKHRVATMLEIRARLTPEQRSRLSALKDEMRDHHHKRGKHGRHHGDKDCRSADPGAEDL